MILLSYPRSGNHWVRFVLEWFSGRPSLGCRTNPRDRPIATNRFTSELNPLEHVDLSAEPVCRKSHGTRGEYALDGEEPLLLLVRDWRECLTRENALNTAGYSYWNALNDMYINYAGRKLLVHYEDLILSPLDTIETIVRFANCFTETKMHEFAQRYETLANLSRTATERDWKPAVSGNDILHHQKNIDSTSFQKIARSHPLNTIELHYEV